MKPYCENMMAEFKQVVQQRKPDFEQFLKVLRKEKPDRFTLFEFLIGGAYQWLTECNQWPTDEIENWSMVIKAYRNAGYDYAMTYASNFGFPTLHSNHGKSSISIDDGTVISDRESFCNYQWQSPEQMDTGRLKKLEKALPDGMKLMVAGPGGVLENVMALVGYEKLSYMMADDPELVQDIFDAVGSRLYEYYELALQYDTVGVCMLNDDWGFNTQTMLSHNDMQQYVFKWHRKIVKLVHEHHRPAILHSCGQLKMVYDDIIDDIGFDGKHSYEDAILPVEKAYELLNPRIAVLGGLDVDFICRHTPEQVYQRACGMLEKSEKTGGYALGSGNSIPDYVPLQNYIAMISAAIFN